MPIIEDLQQLIDAAGGEGGTLARLNGLIEQLALEAGEHPNQAGDGEEGAGANPKQRWEQLPGKFTGTGGEGSTPIDRIREQLVVIRDQKIVAMEKGIEESQMVGADNKRDILHLLLKLTANTDTIAGIRQGIDKLEGRLTALEASQYIPLHEQPERQAENMVK